MITGTQGKPQKVRFPMQGTKLKINSAGTFELGKIVNNLVGEQLLEVSRKKVEYAYI